MDIPEDIPQWAWQRADVDLNWTASSTDKEIIGSLRAQIARALLKAREEAFEEASAIAKHWADGCEAEGNDDGADAAEHLSQAIRQHSQKGERT